MDRQARRDSIVSQISATEAGRQALTVLVEQRSFLNIPAGIHTCIPIAE